MAKYNYMIRVHLIGINTLMNLKMVLIHHGLVVVITNTLY